MRSPVRIASRSSPLALAQVEEVLRDLKALGRVFDTEILKIKTSGDRDKTIPLTKTPDDFFTDSIDRALLGEQADIAIHSAKDLPRHLHKDLKVFALTKGLGPQDAWLSRFHWKDLPLHAKVGTSSALRQGQVLKLRPDVVIVNIRGTIHERIQLVRDAKVDGVVAALCALKRLKLEGEIKDIFPWEGAALQGQLAVVGRRKDRELEDLFSVLDVRPAFLYCGTHPDLYSHLGKILHWPMIDIKPKPLSQAQQKDLLQSLEAADIIVLTSRYAVEHLFLVIARSETTKQSLKEQLKRKIFAVIGAHTKEALQQYGIQATVVANEETAEGLLKAMTQHLDLQGKRIFFPRSSLLNPFLKEALTGLGATVTEITIYENTKPAPRELPSFPINGVIFTSPSTVRNFLTDYGTISSSWQIMAKGPVTLKTLQEAGYPHATSLS